jgi:hypothetical protein
MATLAARFSSYNLSHSLTAEKRRKFFIFPFVNMNNIAVFCNENSTNFRSNKIGRGGWGEKNPLNRQATSQN